MSTVSSIVIPVAVAVVSGGAGSVITTYGTQAKDRRDARSKARESFTKAEETAALTGMLKDDELAGLESSAFTAGIPSYLVEAYKDARQLAAKMRQQLTEAANALAEKPHLLDQFKQAKARSSGADLTAILVSALLLRSLWHPLLARLTRHHRCHQLCLVLADLDPDSASKKLKTRRDRQVFVRDHVQNYRRTERLNKREAKDSLRSGGPPDLHEPAQVSADRGASV